jgi:hypothetical protein
VVHTRIGNLDLDHAALEGLAIESQSLLKTLDIAELDISETLGSLHIPVLDYADAHNLASFEELGHRVDRGVVRKVSEMGSVGRLVGKRRRNALTNGVAYKVPESAGDR